MIDSHCHFDFAEFDEDRNEVWLRALQSGIEAILIPGTESHRFEIIEDLVSCNSNFNFGLGLHPWFLKEDYETQLNDLEKRVQNVIDNMQFVAIGETGLDFAIDVAVNLQERYFIYQLDLARQYSLPVIIHHRKSHNRIIQLLKQYPNVGGVIHAFSGSEQEANSYIEMGFMLGVGATITYERANKTRKALKAVGIENLLLETDAPSMPIFGLQGKRNSPEYLTLIAQCLASLLEVDLATISTKTSANFRKMFLGGERSLRLKTSLSLLNPLC